MKDDFNDKRTKNNKPFWSKHQQIDLEHHQKNVGELASIKENFEKERRSRLVSLVADLAHFVAVKESVATSSYFSSLTEERFIRMIEERATEFIHALEPFKDNDEN